MYGKLYYKQQKQIEYQQLIYQINAPPLLNGTNRAIQNRRTSINFLKSQNMLKSSIKIQDILDPPSISSLELQEFA